MSVKFILVLEQTLQISCFHKRDKQLQHLLLIVLNLIRLTSLLFDQLLAFLEISLYVQTLSVQPFG